MTGATATAWLRLGPTSRRWPGPGTVRSPHTGYAGAGIWRAHGPGQQAGEHAEGARVLHQLRAWWARDHASEDISLRHVEAPPDDSQVLGRLLGMRVAALDDPAVRAARRKALLPLPRRRDAAACRTCSSGGRVVGAGGRGGGGGGGVRGTAGHSGMLWGVVSCWRGCALHALRPPRSAAWAKADTCACWGVRRL